VLSKPFRPNPLLVDEAVTDDNSVATLNPNTIEVLGLFRGDTVVFLIHWIGGKKGRDTVLICLSSDDVEEGRIQGRPQQFVCQARRPRRRAPVSRHKIQRVHILPFDDSIERLSGNIFDVYLKPYFLEAYRPVRK
ncbi:hypothetical protein K438DRAFT_2057859, partial [Mycena galopus ATCC 62051]